MRLLENCKQYVLNCLKKGRKATLLNQLLIAREYLRGIKKIIYASYVCKLFNLLPVKIEKATGDKPRVFLDVSGMVVKDHHTGIQRMVRNLYMAFKNNFSDRYEFLPVYAAIGRRGYFYADAKLVDNEPVFVKTGVKIKASRGDVFLGLDYVPGIILSQSRTLQKLKSLGVQPYFILYDLIPIRYPQYFPFAFGVLHKKWLALAAHIGKIICISRYVCNDVKEWLLENEHGYTLKNISWFHPGHEKIPMIPARKDRYKTPCFLLVGTIEPRKGHIQTLDAFEILWRRGIEATLTFVGKRGWKMDAFYRCLMEHPQLGKKLFWLADCSDLQLESLYNETDCLIVASEAEGYGLPIIEAAARGKPLILRELPVFREVAGNSAYYFRGLTGIDLAEALKEWIALWKNGKEQLPDEIAIQEWRQSAAQLLEIMEKGQAA